MSEFSERIKHGIHFEFNTPKKRSRRLQGLTHDLRVSIFYNPELEGLHSEAGKAFLAPKKIGYIDLVLNPEDRTYVYIRGFYPLNYSEKERSNKLINRKVDYMEKHDLIPFDELESLNPKKQRDRGLGSHVMDKLLAHLKAQGTKSVDIVSTNKSMARVLEKQGFTKEDNVWSKFLD